jgi:hypothetical protein
LFFTRSGERDTAKQIFKPTFPHERIALEIEKEIPVRGCWQPRKPDARLRREGFIYKLSALATG